MLSQKRLFRIRREVEWILRLPSADRKTSLSLLAEKEGVEYETVKKDMYALAYAVIPGGKIPESYEADARAIREAIEKGLLDRQKCESAALIFLEHDPIFDLDRLGITGVDDPYLDEIKSLVLEYAEKTAELKAKRLGWHPARQKAELWRIAGSKIHSELPRLLESSTPEEVLKNVRRLWEENLMRAQAAWHYELALQELKKLAEHAGWDHLLEAVTRDEITLDSITVEWVKEHAPKDAESTRRLIRFLSQVTAARKIFAGRPKQF